MNRDTETTRRIMSAVRNHNTKPEPSLRRALHARGLRYRLRSPLIGKSDIVFGPARVAVFVDGDYWHGTAWRIRGHSNFEAYYGRSDNGSFWLDKIRRNVARDGEVTAALIKAGWTVLRFWESDIERDIAAVFSCLAAEVRADGPTRRRTAG